MYNGDRTKWLKLAYGMLALNLNHYSNKTAYRPDSVIALLDKSFTSNADDALLAYPATSPDFADFNFLGRTRNNVTNFRQTQFVLNLMNGTHFGGVVDPRMSRMLAPSPDGQFRGLDINTAGGRRVRHGPAAEQLLRLRGRWRHAGTGSVPLRRQGEDPGDDVRAAAVHQGGSGIPEG